MPELGNIRNIDPLMAYLENELGLGPQEIDRVRSIMAESGPAKSDPDDDIGGTTDRRAKDMDPAIMSKLQSSFDAWRKSAAGRDADPDEVNLIGHRLSSWQAQKSRTGLSPATAADSRLGARRSSPQALRNFARRFPGAANIGTCPGQAE